MRAATRQELASFQGLPGLRLCKLNPMADLRPGRVKCSSAKLEYSCGSAARQGGPARFYVDNQVGDHATIVERDHINRKTHPACVNAPARDDPQPFTRRE